MEKNTNKSQKKQITLKVIPPLFHAIARETDNKQEWLRKLAEVQILKGKNAKKYLKELKEFCQSNASETYEEALETHNSSK